MTQLTVSVCRLAGHDLGDQLTVSVCRSAGRDLGDPIGCFDYRDLPVTADGFSMQISLS